MSASDCTDAIAGFASADPARLRPLPPACTLEDVAKTLQSLDASSRGVLANRGMDLHWFKSERLPEIHAWVDDAGHVVLLDADWPPTRAEEYANVLGPADHKLDYQWRNSVLPQAELVWLSRGVVVVASPPMKDVLRVGVFAPTTIELYEKNLRFIDIEEDSEG